VAQFNQSIDQRRPDEPGAAGHQKTCHATSVARIFSMMLTTVVKPPVGLATTLIARCRGGLPDRKHRDRSGQVCPALPPRRVVPRRAFSASPQAPTLRFPCEPLAAPRVALSRTSN
jgi:hypothetical protein